MIFMTSTAAPAPSAASTASAPPAAVAGAPAAAPDSAAALPLFAQLLNLTPDDAAPAAQDDAGPAPAADDGAPAAPVADSSAAMASMAATMLAVTLPPPAGQPTAGADAPPGARVDALATSAALNGASARLDLSTAGVAVLASGAAPAATAPAPAAANNAPATNGATAAARTAAETAQTVAASAEAPTAGIAGTASIASRAASAAAPVAAAPGAGAPPGAPVAAGARTTERGASRAADNNGATAGATPAAVPAATAGDDNAPVVVRAEPAPAAVNGGYAPAGQTPAAADSVKLAGAPDQWRQPLREALGDRLQLQLQRNDEHAVIRLEPPNMGRVEISIRHTAGALQVNLSANNSEVLRQLNSIGDSVRQDLSQRQFADVAVTVSASPRGMLAGGDGNGRGQQHQHEDARTPGRALSDDSDAAASFAMSTERE